MTRCALYLRLSHDGPDETSNERQETDCRKLAEAKGWEVVAVYKDLQSAWSDKARPDFERMLRDGGSGAFDVVLVWKFDRMARSVLTFEQAVRGLTGCGVRFASLSESVDTTTPMGTLRFTWPGRWLSSSPTPSPTEFGPPTATWPARAGLPPAAGGASATTGTAV